MRKLFTKSLAVVAVFTLIATLFAGVCTFKAAPATGTAKISVSSVQATKDAGEQTVYVTFEEASVKAHAARFGLLFNKNLTIKSIAPVSANKDTLDVSWTTVNGSLATVASGTKTKLPAVLVESVKATADVGDGEDPSETIGDGFDSFVLAVTFTYAAVETAIDYEIELIDVTAAYDADALGLDTGVGDFEVSARYPIETYPTIGFAGEISLVDTVDYINFSTQPTYAVDDCSLSFAYTYNMVDSTRTILNAHNVAGNRSWSFDLVNPATSALVNIVPSTGNTSVKQKWAGSISGFIFEYLDTQLELYVSIDSAIGTFKTEALDISSITTIVDQVADEKWINLIKAANETTDPIPLTTKTVVNSETDIVTWATTQNYQPNSSTLFMPYAQIETRLADIASEYKNYTNRNFYIDLQPAGADSVNIALQKIWASNDHFYISGFPLNYFNNDINIAICVAADDHATTATNYSTINIHEALMAVTDSQNPFLTAYKAYVNG